MKKIIKKGETKVMEGNDTLEILYDYGYDSGKFEKIKVCLALVDIRTINSDVQEIQREVTVKRVNEIVKDFHISRLDLPTIAIMKTGERRCLDGQARIVSMRTLFREGKINSPMMPCKVLFGANQEELAELFSRQDEGKTVLREVDKTKAELVWKDTTKSLNDILKNNNISLMADVKAHTAIKKVFANTTLDVFNRMVNVLSSSWDVKNTKNALSSQILSGLHCFYGLYSNEIDDMVLIGKLRKMSPDKIISDYKSYDVSNDKNRKYLKTFTMIYNKSKKNNRIDYV